MSRKSRRHGRHLPRSKRRRHGKGFYTPPQPSAAAPQPPAVAQPTPRTEMAVPVAKASTPQPTGTLARLPNVAAELRRIGILSGIILAILIALAFILP